MLNNPWAPDVDHSQQLLYQHVVDCIYWSVLGPFNNWKIIHYTNKTTCSEDFDEVHQVVLYVISANMASLIYTGKYGAINEEDTTTLGYYAVEYVYEPFIVQYDITTYGQVSKSG